MKYLLNTIILISLLRSCDHAKSEPGNKILDFGSFTIETPQSWAKVKAQVMDSYVGRIAIDNKDTLEFDLGWYSNTLINYEFGDKVVRDTIDGYHAKIIYPRKVGKGVTGIYIDSLCKAGYDIDRFNLYGSNLKGINQKRVLEVFRSLKFHNKCRL